MQEPAVEFQNVDKFFGPVKALIDFSHGFARGATHALMGRNGSGKSTLIKMIGGVMRPSAGRILVGGTPIAFESPRDAQRRGIATVYQELSLIPSLSVAENLFMGDLGQGRRVIEWRKLNRRAESHLATMGIAIGAKTPVSALSVGQQQVLEVAKAMRSDPSILIFDEATSALANKEVEQIFGLIRDLKRRGVTILYVTHRMSEIFEVADTCTVLRDGRFIDSRPMSELSHRTVVDLMFGQTDVVRRPARTGATSSPAMLKVDRLGRASSFSDVSFEVRRGEILGIAGILGSGRTEILRSLFGADRPDHGTVTVDGTMVSPVSPMQMKRLGVGFTPENRKEVGLVQDQSCHANLCMASLRRIAPYGLISRRREAPAVIRQVRDLAIKIGDASDAVSTLSGGNQQKIVVGKWLNRSPKVLLLDEPTRGIDVHAKRQLFEIVWRKAAEGLAVVFVSSELEEILEVADRVLMLRHGRIVAEAPASTLALSDLYSACLGA